MRNCSAVLFAILLTLGLVGCASKKSESSSTLYDGDAPSIKYYGTEAAGGPLNNAQ
jgi:hypothetical protein